MCMLVALGYLYTQLAGPDRGSDACTFIAAIDPNERNLTQHTY